MSYIFYSSKKLLNLISEHSLDNISDIVIRTEKEITGHNKEELFSNMKRHLNIMKESALSGIKNKKKSRGNMVNFDSNKIKGIKEEKILISEVMRVGIKYALGIMENNACMGRIVAAPTAGSSGIIPGCVLSMQENWELPEESAIRGMLAASGIGMIIASISTFSAAMAGCQAEIGTATCMAAAAISEMRGLSPERCCNAAALALKSLLGLACDPIGGLVEVPCIKRNAMGVSIAMTASDLSFAGVTSIVPLDQVIEAMNNVSQNMNKNLKETAQGGLAISKTAKKIMANLEKCQLCSKRNLN